MSDWQVGDLALCVEIGADDVFRIEGIAKQAPGPIAGLTYTVARVSSAFDCYGTPGIALALVEIPQRHPRAIGYNSAFFRKIEARQADEFDLETIALLNGQPAKRELAAAIDVLGGEVN